jgi:hypothetical protein
MLVYPKGKDIGAQWAGIERQSVIHSAIRPIVDCGSKVADKSHEQRNLFHAPERVTLLQNWRPVHFVLNH